MENESKDLFYMILDIKWIFYNIKNINQKQTFNLTFYKDLTAYQFIANFWAYKSPLLLTLLYTHH